MKEGLIIYDCIGGGQSNLVAGDFSLNVGLGYKVENGEITGRIKNAMLSGNVYEEFLHNLEALSLEQKKLSSALIPAFYFKRMNIIGK
jgi:PmbA protein